MEAVLTIAGVSGEAVLEGCLVLAQAVYDQPLLLPGLTLPGAVIWVCPSFAFVFQCPENTQVS